MKIPVNAPQLIDFLASPGDVSAALRRQVGPEIAGEYLHWDQLRHREPPAGLTSTQWWLAVKLARVARARPLSLADKQGQPFEVGLTDTMLRRLHFLDREAAGLILGVEQDDSRSMRRKYLERSLIEEAMTSSQLEGASTTRRVAKEMLTSGREPRDRSERMIFNNYATMQALSAVRDRDLTPSMIMDIHRHLMTDAMDDPDDVGRWRSASDDVMVFDRADPTRILHVPPHASEMPERMRRLCDFANTDDKDGTFLHPIVRAILLHFMIGYDHPFVDGNGRTARALFYWSMLRSGYWLSEYISISSILRKAPDAYAKSYLRTETDGVDTGYFVYHQLGVIVEAVASLRDYLGRKAQERKEAEALLHPASNVGRAFNHRQRALLLHALKRDGDEYTIARHQSEHRVSYATARSDLLQLEEAGLLKQRLQGKKMIFTPAQDLVSHLGLN